VKEALHLLLLLDVTHHCCPSRRRTPVAVTPDNHHRQRFLPPPQPLSYPQCERGSQQRLWRALDFCLLFVGPGAPLQNSKTSDLCIEDLAGAVAGLYRLCSRGSLGKGGISVETDGWDWL
jgi:hypothetical protein